MKVNLCLIQKVETDRNIPNKKQDVLIREDEKEICVLSTPKFHEMELWTRKKKDEEVLKYKDLTIETQHMWSFKQKWCQ